MSKPLDTKLSTPLSENAQILKYSRLQSGQWGGATLGGAGGGATRGTGRHLGGGATLGTGRHLGGGATRGTGRHLGGGATLGAGLYLGGGLHVGRGYTWGGGLHVGRGGATLGGGGGGYTWGWGHVLLHPPPIPLVYTANLIGVDPSMCIPLLTIL